MNVSEFISHIKCSGAPTDPGIIDDLEFEIDGGLPSEYRQFLNRCNGGYVNGSLGFESGGKAGTVTIHAVGGGEHGLWLTNRREDFWGRIPEQLRWIMSDPFGNGFLLGVNGDARGRIYFWFMEEELGQAPDAPLSNRTDIQLIANSFDDLLVGLRHRA
ncbi:SMI1/KNR4 family protein [Variovorax sp. ZS18.2.2]|uniref:SMI1/KNR4 family protein n=1 Tax=Variovorax sp. ZS18.2.2 TaxID=2971255 RepID=UPI002151E0DB|nr:SMI1/KNR4 family protein [Variovorax sp. ZS18.2.2]MCR6480704.1 SMI1/KNR4 family protein [Variovorax sp. ZS18.2.2]